MGKRPLVRLAAAVAGGVFVFAAAPVWADAQGLTNPLPILAKNVTQDCDDERMADREADRPVWRNHAVEQG